MLKNTDSLVKTRDKTATREMEGLVYREATTSIIKSKLQSGAHFIGRMIHLCSMRPGCMVFSYNDASKIVAQELSNDWISNNVYSLCQQNIAKKLRDESRTCTILVTQHKNYSYKKMSQCIHKVHETDSEDRDQNFVVTLPIMPERPSSSSRTTLPVQEARSQRFR